MSYLFYYCKSLIEVPDISEWDTSNITNMRDLFNNCESLKSLGILQKLKILVVYLISANQ